MSCLLCTMQIYVDAYLFSYSWLNVPLAIPYSGLFLRGKIFVNFTNPKQFVKILPLKCLLFNRYSLQSVTIFPLKCWE